MSSGGQEKESRMKRIISIVWFLVLAALLGFGQQSGAFFRIVAPANTKITAFNSQGYIIWTNSATDGVTCTVQRAATLAGPSNWVDYVRHRVTNATMNVRVHDPNPPAGMVLIPAGMNVGNDPDFGAYALTIQTTLYMDATEVTWEKWQEVRDWSSAKGYDLSGAGAGKAADHPVQQVNWYECAKWCNARSEKEGKTPCYTNADGSVYTNGSFSCGCNWSASGYRLPTKTEWEYAARGGLSGKRFPWGDVIDHTRANYCAYPQYYFYDQGYAGYDTRYATGEFPYIFTSPAGSFAPNGFGLYDMAGNVWEWCWESSDKGARLIRGGAWDDNAGNAQCGSSDWFEPGVAYSVNGFRTVCR